MTEPPMPDPDPGEGTEGHNNTRDDERNAARDHERDEEQLERVLAEVRRLAGRAVLARLAAEAWDEALRDAMRRALAVGCTIDEVEAAAGSPRRQPEGVANSADPDPYAARDSNPEPTD